MQWLLVILLLGLPSLAWASVYVRYDTQTKRLTQYSTVAFTTPPEATETEAVIDQDTPPAAIEVLRVNAKGTALEVDPELAQARETQQAADTAQSDAAKVEHTKLTIEERLNRIEQRLELR